MRGKIQAEEQMEDGIPFDKVHVRLSQVREGGRHGRGERGQAGEVLLRVLRKEILEAPAVGEYDAEHKLPQCAGIRELGKANE